MIYRYKATVSGNKVFMREYELDSSMSLFKFRTFLNNDLGFSQDQMTLFETLSPSGKVSRRIGMFDFGDGSMDRVTVNDCIARDERVLKYVYNPSLGLALVLENIGEAEYNPRFSYPLTVAEKGRNPDQFSAAYDEFMEGGMQVEEPDEAGFEDEELPEGEEGA